MCIAQLDHKLMERGLVCAPKTVPTFDAAVVSAEKIRFFKGSVDSKCKFHVTVGHTTTMATAEFMGEVPTKGAAESATVAAAEKLLAALSTTEKGGR